MSNTEVGNLVFGILTAHFFVGLSLGLWGASYFFPRNMAVGLLVIVYQFLMHVAGVTVVLLLLKNSRQIAP